MAQKYEGVTLSRKQIFINNLIGGVAWAIGASIGLSLLIAIIGFIASRVDFVPIVGDFVSNVANYTVEKSGQ